MKKLFLATLLLAPGLWFAACATPEAEAAGTQYGEELTLVEMTPVSDILADPEAFVGQRVLVEATVVAVCESKGCWMELASESGSETLKIKVDDGVITFPLTAKGLRARAEGVVERLDFTVEQAIAQAEMEATEHGTEFDPSSITEPTTTYQIKGIGVVIEDQA